MKYLIIGFFGLVLHFQSLGQCTLSASGTINWSNASPPLCEGGGNAGSATIIIIPSDLTVIFNDNADTWTGVRIEVEGTLRINPAGQATIDASIVVKDGGLLRIDSKLNIGGSTGCGHTLVIEDGGSADITGGTPDRLNICGKEISRGGTNGCNPYPTGPLPYCEPASGFTGPVGFDETGVNPSLPVELLSFAVTVTTDKKVEARWSTASELDAEYFTIERSLNGKDFIEIGRLPAAGTSSSRKDYLFVDEKPIIGRSYYRLRQSDFNGNAQGLGIRFADVEGVKGVFTYPNPWLDQEEVTLALNFSTDEVSFVRITDISGHVLDEFSFSGSEVALRAKPRKGAYIITVINGNERFVTRFIAP